MIDAKAYLQQLARYKAYIDALETEIHAEYCKGTQITAQMKDVVVSGGGPGDKVGNAATKIADMKDRKERYRLKHDALEQDIKVLLEKLENENHFKVLHRKYILGEELKWIGAEMGYSYRHICRLHGFALLAFDKILKEEKHEEV